MDNSKKPLSNPSASLGAKFSVDALEGRERRITLRLMAYWEFLRGDRPFPKENDIDPEAIADLWDSCFLVQVRDLTNVLDYNYSYLGKDISEAYLGGLQARDPGCHIASPNARSLSHGYDKVLETKQPYIEEGEFINLSGARVKFRQILFPIGAGDEVEAIFGGMRFKIYW